MKVKSAASKSIKGKIIQITISILVVLTVLSIILSSVLNYSNTMRTLRKTLTETVKVAAGKIESEIDGYKRLIYSISTDPVISDVTKSKEERFARLKSAAEVQGFTMYGMTDADGFTSENGQDLSKTAYFTNCKESGRTYISDPIILEEGKSAIVIMAAPMMVNKQFQGIVFFAKDAAFLSEIAQSIQVGAKGTTTVINKQGNSIAYTDYQYVLDQYSVVEQAAKDKNLKKLVEISQNMMQAKTGFGEYSYNGQQILMVYAPITNSDGWSISLSVTKTEFLSGFISSILFNILVSVLISLVSILILIRMTKPIGDSIKKCSERLVLLSEGDLHSSVPEIDSDDETKILHDAMQVTINKLSNVIGDVSLHLGKIAEGNLMCKVERDYEGDLIPVQVSLETIRKSLEDSMKQIGLNANQVAAGSQRLAEGSQTLSQAAVEQAGSVEELCTFINELSMRVEVNVNHANQASIKANDVGNHMVVSNEQMQKMVQAMADISDSANEIKKIIDTIEDIASQTNLLSLNASIEAARAGEAGKGFAVVANEVGTLAEESSRASKNSKQLIEKSLASVEHGIRIADETANMLLSSVSGAKEVAGIVDLIYEESGRQQESISQIKTGVDHISGIIQTNSAMAEESAGSSEELSALSQLLKELVEKFEMEP